MNNATQQIVNKAWNFAHVLRDDGLSYMAYTEQITFLLFLKMVHEQTLPPHKRAPIVPPELGWESLLAKDGDALEVHYRHVLDELGKKPGERFSMVLTNPPFGKKSSIAIVTEEGDLEKEDHSYSRDDFWTTTKNKQLNFLQHIKTLLRINGRCAVVLPDNVLFEGGAGETVRRNLLKNFEVHTLLRLPTGIFYAQGVKANVLFFDARPAQEAPWTSRLWVYDLRTNMHFTLKTNPLKRADLDEFVACYNPANRYERKELWSEANSECRWRSFGYEELAKRDKLNLDIFWLKDKTLEDSDNLPEPDVLAQEIAEDLQAALDQFAAVAAELRGRSG